MPAKPDVEGLNATGELLPDDCRGTVKPVKLTYLFDVKEVFDKGVAYNPLNQEYFIDGAQVTYKALQKLVDKDYPNLDLDEKLGQLLSEGLFNHYQC